MLLQLRDSLELLALLVALEVEALGNTSATSRAHARRHAQLVLEHASDVTHGLATRQLVRLLLDELLQTLDRVDVRLARATPLPRLVTPDNRKFI